MTTISAVVPSAGRPALLARCLRGLATSSGPLERVVVVYDGDAATAAVLDGFEPRLPLLAVTGEQRGASARRNQGARLVGSDVLAFTDDDCEPSASWSEALATAVDGPVDVARGPVLPHPEDIGVTGTFARTLDMPKPQPVFAGANLAVRRDAFERVGGFDETMAGGEDTDLAWRVIETADDAGAAAAWAPDALVWHAVRAVSFTDHLRSLPRWSALALVARRHPHLRDGLTGGLFWKPEHVTALLLLAGLVLAPADARALALALPHLARRIAPHGLYAGTQLAVSDVVELLVLAAGSVEHRSLVL